MDTCINCHDHFEQLRPNIKEVIISHHFHHDIKDFQTSLILDIKHEHFTRLPKFEETFDPIHIFRALKDRVNIVYAIKDD